MSDVPIRQILAERQGLVEPAPLNFPGRATTVPPRQGVTAPTSLNLPGRATTAPPARAATPSLDLPGRATVNPPGQAASPGDLGGLGQEAIDAALAAIEAETGLTREQLLADRSDIGRQYRFLIAQQQRARREALEGVENAALERGIFRSGIAAENVASTEARFAEQIAGLQAQQATQQGAVDARLAVLPQQAAAARAQAASGVRNQVLDVDLLRALLNAGL